MSTAPPAVCTHRPNPRAALRARDSSPFCRRTNWDSEVSQGFPKVTLPGGGRHGPEPVTSISICLSPSAPSQRDRRREGGKAEVGGKEKSQV